MLTKNIFFKNFALKKKNKKISLLFNNLLKEDNEIINSLKKDYKDSYQRNLISKLKKHSRVNIIGIGGSSLGSKSIYSFLKKKIKKNFQFQDNLETSKLNHLKKKDVLNLIISKSGNTLETISNSNVLIKESKKNIFITEKRKSFLRTLADKMKSEIINHNNFIGGRYSVLSEVGMLPAELMGLNVNKFRKFNSLIKNKKFCKSLILNVSNTLNLIKKKNLIL